MELLKRDDLKAMAGETAPPCLTLAMPVHSAGAELKQDSIVFKNLMKDAARQLEERGLQKNEIETILQPVQSLVEGENYFQGKGEGFILFRCQDSIKHYVLPGAPEAAAVVADHYYIRPLLPFLRPEGSFYILALSIKDARLLRCTETSSEAVPFPEGTPTSLDSAVQLEVDKQVMEHSGPANRAGANRGSEIGGTFFGKRDEDEAIVQNFGQFAKKIDRAVREVLREEKTPLVAACVEWEFAHYKEHNSYPHLLPDYVAGSPDGLLGGELHRRALQIMQKYWDDQRQQLLEQYEEMYGEGRTSTSIKELVQAAHDGRVSHLLVAQSAPERPGSFDESTYKVRVHKEAQPGDEDLINIAALQTLVNGGEVLLMPRNRLPGHSPIAALLRY